MKQQNMDDFIRDHKKDLDRSFPRKDAVWTEIQSELGTSRVNSHVNWWKPLIRVAAAVVLGLLSVWGLQEYRELTAFNSEMTASFDFYESTEIRLIKNISENKLYVSEDILQDLEEIDASLKLLKKVFLQAPENKKEWVFGALIELYELKIQLLEKIIYYDHLEQKNTNKNGTSL